MPGSASGAGVEWCRRSQGFLERSKGSATPRRRTSPGQGAGCTARLSRVRSPREKARSGRREQASSANGRALDEACCPPDLAELLVHLGFRMCESGGSRRISCGHGAPVLLQLPRERCAETDHLAPRLGEGRWFRGRLQAPQLGDGSLLLLDATGQQLRDFARRGRLRLRQVEHDIELAADQVGLRDEVCLAHSCDRRRRIVPHGCRAVPVTVRAATARAKCEGEHRQRQGSPMPAHRPRASRICIYGSMAGRPVGRPKIEACGGTRPCARVPPGKLTPSRGYSFSSTETAAVVSMLPFSSAVFFPTAEGIPSFEFTIGSIRNENTPPHP